MDEYRLFGGFISVAWKRKEGKGRDMNPEGKPD